MSIEDLIISLFRLKHNHSPATKSVPVEAHTSSKQWNGCLAFVSERRQ